MQETAVMKRCEKVAIVPLVFAVVASVALVVSSSCRAPQQPNDGTGGSSVESVDRQPPQRSAASSRNIADVLSLLEKGNADEAVGLFLELVKAGAPDTAFRPTNLSEDAFVRLPAAERDRLQSELLATFHEMRVFAKEIDRRGHDALARGDRDGAQTLFDGLMRLGDANTGKQVTKLADLVGQAIVKRAKQGLGAMTSATG